jgi:hypothetical protein
MDIIDSATLKDKHFEDIVSEFHNFHNTYKSQIQISDVHLIVKESKWTELLMKMLEYGNSHALSNFAFRLEMEDRPNNGLGRTQTNGYLDSSFHIPKQQDKAVESL